MSKRFRVPLSTITETGLSFSVEAPVAAVQPEGAADLPLERFSLSGVFTLAGHTILFRGKLRADFAQSCDRCLETVASALDTELIWAFEEGPVSALLDGDIARARGEWDRELGDNVCTYQGHEVDLGPYCWEELVLAAPEKILCRPDCRGLCSRCGANLNTGACGCPAEAGDSERTGLAALADLYPDLAKPDDKEK